VAANDHGLATVQNVAVPGLLGTGFHVIQVVKALGLLKTDSSLCLAAGDAAKPLFVLLTVAGLADQPATENHGLQVGLDTQAATQFGHHALNFNASTAKSTEFLRKGDGGQAQFTQLFPEVGAEAQLRFAVFQAFLKTVFTAHQAGHGVLQHLLLFVESEIHGRLLKARESFSTRYSSGSRWIRRKSTACGC